MADKWSCALPCWSLRESWRASIGGKGFQNCRSNTSQGAIAAVGFGDCAPLGVPKVLKF